jgi:hypothetical protein
MAEELFGQVVMWSEQKKYGFIEYDKFGKSCRMFFIRSSCRPDALGRVSDCFIPETLVKFSIERQIHRGEGRLIACDVRPAFREEFTGDVDAHRENGQIVRWLISQKNGFVKRPGSEHIYFQSGDVVPGHETQFRNLQEGDWIYYGIGSRVRNEVLEFRAINIECYSDEEQARLRQGLPLEPEPPAPSPESELVSVCAPETRQLSLIEIVRRNRNGNS